MTETVYLNNPEGPLELYGGEHESALILNGLPIQLTYLREIGTTERYQIARDIPESEVIQDEQFRNMVRYGHLGDSSLQAQFAYILSKLTSGQYQLEVMTVDTGIYLWDVPSQPDYFHSHSYGGLADILATQSFHDEDIVDYYRQLIQQGFRPIMVIITSSASQSSFILDGHHKFRAYASLRLSGQALVITKLDAAPINDALGMMLLRQCHTHDLEYQNRFLDR